MVALLHDHTVRPAPSRPVRSTGARSASRRHLTVVTPAPADAAVPVWVVLAVTAVVLGFTMAGLRLAQGAPPSSSWADLRSESVTATDASAQPGDLIVLVRSGDTLWSIAQRLAPGRDPRPVVDALTRANGGSQVQAGQQVVIPASMAG